MVPICKAIEQDENAPKGEPDEPELYQVNRYETFLKEMKLNWWRERERGTVCETDTDYIRTFSVKKGIAGKVMELCCPEKKAISIFGQSQIASQPELEPPEFKVREPYFLALRCCDSENKELDNATRLCIRIVVAGVASPLKKVRYGDLRPLRRDTGEFKIPEERYHFPEGIFLSGGDCLEIEAINPDIDVERVEVRVEADIFQEKTTSTISEP